MMNHAATEQQREARDCCEEKEVDPMLKYEEKQTHRPVRVRPVEQHSGLKAGRLRNIGATCVALKR